MYLSVCAFVPGSYKVKRSIELPITSKKAFNYFRSSVHILSWNSFLDSNDLTFEGDEGLIGFRIGNDQNYFTIEAIEPTSKLVFKTSLEDYQSLKKMTFLFNELDNGKLQIEAWAQGSHPFLKRLNNLRMNNDLDKKINRALKQMATDLSQQ